MNESNIYNSLRKEILLADVLPELKQGQLNRTGPISCNQSEILKHLESLKEAKGWCLYSDVFHTGELIPEKSNIIQGEWIKGDKTTSLQLIEDNQYLITTMEKTGDSGMLYHETKLRNRDAGTNTYRIWWQEIEGRYQPIAQQYLGTKSNNKSENQS